ncbi:MAG: ROK family protein, partial [Chloroflexota bacterium]|nr:ROK family protein [Chloroflexota bacterium]
IAPYRGSYLLTQEVCRFDPALALERLQAQQELLSIDIGGDKLRSAIYRARDGRLEKLSEDVYRSSGGAGYLALLERLARQAAADDLRVGISSATKLDGSVVIRTVNLPIFFRELGERYGADFENLFPGRSFVANDTITGVCGASSRLALDGNPPRDIAFVICASGLGGSVIKNETAIHVEVGHVPLVPSLNPLDQTSPCGVEGRQHVCVERVTASRAGIEDLYRQQTGESLDGVAIGRLYEQRDELATVLYETSARALTHALVGMMERYRFPNSDESVVVLHGGTFEIARYREAVRRDLDRIPHPRCRVVFSRDLSDNVCLDGAAVLAACYAGQVERTSQVRA